MATAAQYAEWIVRNKDKKGSPEFETVAKAYRLAKEQESAAPAAEPASEEAAPEVAAAERPSMRDVLRQRLMGGEVFETPQREAAAITAGMTPEQKAEAARTGLGLAASFAAGGVLGAGARGLGVAIPAISRFTTPLATSLETAGIQTGLTRTTPAAARLATRVAGGAVPAAIGGAVISPEEAGTAAAIGTGVALVAPPVARVVAKGSGAVIDAVLGRTADTRANELVRLAANDQINALRQAMAAQPDVPASRVVANLAESSGQNFDVLQALLAEAERKSPQKVINAFRRGEAQDTLNELARIAGGPTAETARAARETAKESLGELTGRMREEAMAAARRTGEVMPRLQTIAAEARQEAAEKVAEVRRFAPAIDRANEWAKSWAASGGARAASAGLAPRPPTRYTFPGQLAERIPERMGAAAQESLQAGARARAAENTLQSMRDRGLQPITVDKFTAPIDRLLADPEIATNPVLAKALPQVRQMFEDWTNQFGVITPEAISAIRKNGIAGVIQQVVPTADAKTQSRLAAQVLSRLRPAVDEAIETAGGKGWVDYLKSFERGMADIKGMELADRIRQLYAKGTPESKQQIIDLVRGESPDVIEDLFGSGRYQISQAMSKDMPLLRRIADTLELDLAAVQQAAAGRAALTEAQKRTSIRLKFPFFTRASTAVNEVIVGLEQKMKAETLDRLIRAAQSGREFNRVLDSLPTKERAAFLAQFKNADSWGRFSTQVANAARAYAVSQVEPATNVMAPESQNALAP
jgi:hypothetical protein